MAKLVWDQTSEKLYETGVEKGVLYPQSSAGTYPKGVAWNGLSKVSESPSGAEATAVYANNRKYLNMISAEEFGGTIEAYTYPDEWMDCDGSKEVAPGVYLGQQNRKPFGFCYRTILGNDTDLNDYGYKLHIVYNALAAPSSKEYSTVNDSPEAMTLSWEFKTTPVEVEGSKPTATIVIDSTKTDADKLATLEAILYGSTSEDARLPLPEEVIAILGGTATPSVLLNTHGTSVDEGSDVTLTATTVPASQTVTWSTSNGDTATVANGVVSGVAAGNAIITAAITVDGVTYTDTCTVVVKAV